jgi:hypothetical protein
VSPIGSLPIAELVDASTAVVVLVVVLVTGGTVAVFACTSIIDVLSVTVVPVALTVAGAVDAADAVSMDVESGAGASELTCA